MTGLKEARWTSVVTQFNEMDMKLITQIIASAVVCSSLVLSAEHANAQQDFEVPVTNPRGVIRQRIAATDIEVSYNRPSVKGRTIFGGLIPYGQVWRTGSDASTKISFSTPVFVNGKNVAAGTYELFTIPGEKEWTIILQPSRNQWGSYGYKEEFDAHRSVVASQQLTESMETFTVSFDQVTSKSADLSLSWARVRVAIPITIDLKATVLPQLEESLAKEGKKPYFRAAMFYFENDLDINRSAELMQLAINENPNHLGMLYRFALILERKGDKAGALAASEKSWSEAQKAAPELKEEYVKLNTVLLARLKK